MLSGVIQSNDKWKNAQQLKNKCYSHQLSLTDEGVLRGQPLELLCFHLGRAYSNHFCRYVLSVFVFWTWNNIFCYRNVYKLQSPHGWHTLNYVGVVREREVLERIIIPEAAYFDYPNRDIFVQLLASKWSVFLSGVLLLSAGKLVWLPRNWVATFQALEQCAHLWMK